MHKSKLVTAVIDCQTDDLTEAALFWSAALGRQADLSDDPATEKYVRVGSGNEELIVLLQKVPHAKPRSPRYRERQHRGGSSETRGTWSEANRKDKNLVGYGGANRAPVLRGSAAAQWCNARRCKRMELMAG